MSYCRNPVYIIGNASHPGWTCFNCTLNIRSRRDLLRHMISHLRKGEKIPAYATNRVIREIIRHRRNK